MTIQVEAIELYFKYSLVCCTSTSSLNQTLQCDHSNYGYQAVRSSGTLRYQVFCKILIGSERQDSTEDVK